MMCSDFSFSHFIFHPLFWVECKCQHSWASSYFHMIRRCEINGMNNFSNLTSASSYGPRCEVYAVCSCTSFFYAFCCTYPYLMFDEGSCLLVVSMIPAWCDVKSFVWCTCCHDSSCCVLRSFVGWWDTHVVVMYVLHWDPCYAMLAGCSSCMSMCDTDRSPFDWEFL